MPLQMYHLPSSCEACNRGRVVLLNTHLLPPPTCDAVCLKPRSSNGGDACTFLFDSMDPDPLIGPSCSRLPSTAAVQHSQLVSVLTEPACLRW